MRRRPAYAGEQRDELNFPTLEREGKRAERNFGIDIEESFRGWMVEMLGSVAAGKLLREGLHATVRAHTDLTPDLSPREREMLTLAACGYTRTEIAEMLFIGPETVASHLKRAHAKMRTTRQAHAAIIAILVGELDIDLMRKHLFRNWEVD